MEVAEGEEYTREAFEGYFFAADVVVGVFARERSGDGLGAGTEDGVEIASGTGNPLGPPGSSKDGLPLAWEDIIAGFYYVGFFSSPPFGKYG